MRKIILIIVIAASFISCEDAFEPKADFSEDYVLFGIMNGDTSYQSIILSRSYDVNGFDPLTNTDDPDVKEATVKLMHNNNTYILRDSSIVSPGSRYNTPQYFFYTNEIDPKEGDVIEVKAELSNGKTLISKTTLPFYSLFVFDKVEELYPIENFDKLLFHWVLNSVKEDLVYAPRFLIHYTENINGTEVAKFKEVPTEHKQQGNKLIPVFPSPSGRLSVLYDTNSVNRTINEIEPDTSKRSRITIIKGEIEVSVMDENLGSYYTSVQTASDGFSIQLYETNYSNINGGIGVFGSFFMKRKDVKISPLFIRSLGYKSK